jgi:hypothetical protein
MWILGLQLFEVFLAFMDFAHVDLVLLAIGFLYLFPRATNMWQIG